MQVFMGRQLQQFALPRLRSQLAAAEHQGTAIVMLQTAIAVGAEASHEQVVITDGPLSTQQGAGGRTDPG